MSSAHLEPFIAFDNDESSVPAIKLMIPFTRLGKSNREHFYAMDTKEAKVLAEQLMAMVKEQESTSATIL